MDYYYIPTVKDTKIELQNSINDAVNKVFKLTNILENQDSEIIKEIYKTLWTVYPLSDRLGTINSKQIKDEFLPTYKLPEDKRLIAVENFWRGYNMPE